VSVAGHFSDYSKAIPRRSYFRIGTALTLGGDIINAIRNPDWSIIDYDLTG
jgi:hypothetical protein